MTVEEVSTADGHPHNPALQRQAGVPSAQFRFTEKLSLAVLRGVGTWAKRCILVADDDAAVRYGLPIVLAEQGIGDCREAGGR